MKLSKKIIKKHALFVLLNSKLFDNRVVKTDRILLWVAWYTHVWTAIFCKLLSRISLSMEVSGETIC